MILAANTGWAETSAPRKVLHVALRSILPVIRSVLALAAAGVVAAAVAVAVALDSDAD